MATAVKSPNAVIKSEDALGERWDKCLADTGIKMATGLAVGMQA